MPLTEQTEQFTELLRQRDWARLRELLEDLHAPELADLLFELEPPDRVLLFRMLPRAVAAEVFAFLEGGQRQELLEDLTDEETQRLLGSLAPDDRTHLFEELPGQAVQRLLNLLSPDDLREAAWLLGYPEETAGRLMTPNYVAVRPHWTIGQALAHIRRWGQRSETLNVIYVTDDEWKLLDELDVRLFLLHDPDLPVAELMDDTFTSVPALMDREEAVKVMQRYDLYAVPVADAEGVLLGIVTADDLMDVAEEEVTEDFHRTAAVTPLRAPYRLSGFGELYRRRIGWLMGLAMVNLISSGVIAAYEEVLAAVLALAFFVPLLIGTGGNAGAQAATLIVRALATGDVRRGDWLRVIGKELLVGSLLGLTLGATGYLLGLFRGGPLVALVVGLSMTSIVLMANLIGMALPLLLTRLRQDPAVASGPLITSLVDAGGLLLYFNIARWLLAH